MVHALVLFVSLSACRHLWLRCPLNGKQRYLMGHPVKSTEAFARRAICLVDPVASR
jgi:hypothetical protein